MTIKEIRSGFKFDIRSIGAEGIIEGYASMFNKPVPSYKEKVMPGAFTKTLKENRGRVPVFYMHNSLEWIGMGLSGEEDDKGLLVRAQLNIANSARAMEIYSMLAMANDLKNPAGLSIGFMTVKESQKGEWRHLDEIDLMEWSPTPPRFQAAPGAKVTNTRALIDIIDDIRSLNKSEYEALLRNAFDKPVRAAVNQEPDFIHSVNEALKDCLRKL